MKSNIIRERSCAFKVLRYLNNNKFQKNTSRVLQTNIDLTVSGMGKGLNELLGLGFITKEKFNKRDSIYDINQKGEELILKLIRIKYLETGGIL